MSNAAYSVTEVTIRQVFFDLPDGASSVVLANNIIRALEADGHLMPDLPPPTSTYGGVWEEGDLDISAEEDGAVLIEYSDDYDGDIWGTQTSRTLTLTRAQVLAVLAASEWNPNDQH